MSIRFWKYSNIFLIFFIFLSGFILFGFYKNTFAATTYTDIVSCSSIKSGDNIKMHGRAAIFLVDENSKGELVKKYYPDGDVFKSWNEDEDYSSHLKYVNQSCFDSIKTPSAPPYNAFYRPGSYILKTILSEELYVVEPGNTLEKISKQAAQNLYGSKLDIKTIGLGEFGLYIKKETEITEAKPYPGMLIRKDGTTYYLDENNELREVSVDGMKANRFKEDFVLYMVGDVIQEYRTTGGIDEFEKKLALRNEYNKEAVTKANLTVGKPLNINNVVYDDVEIVGSCYDSDGGEDLYTKGTGTVVQTAHIFDVYGREVWPFVQTKTWEDSCAGANTLNEVYCYVDVDRVGYFKLLEVGFDCKYGCSDGVCLKEEEIPVPEPEPISFSWAGTENACGDGVCAENESEYSCLIDCNFDNDFSIIRENQLSVMYPKGYELLAQADLKDLQYCMPLISNFLDITPYYNYIFLKIYIDNNNLGHASKNGLFSRRTQSNIDFDLKDLVENYPQGFLYNSGLDYCANTHELTHVFMSHLKYYLVGWMNEGVSEYTQKNVQGDAKDHLECRENGVYRQDWEDNGYKVFPYKTLLGGIDSNIPHDSDIWYTTGMCFWEYIDETYGRDKFQQIFKKLDEIYYSNTDFNPREKTEEERKDFLFDQVFKPILGDQIEGEIESRFGI